MKLDYETVYRAVKGDHDAQEKLLQYYDAYISALSTVVEICSDGTEHQYVCEDQKAEIQQRIWRIYHLRRNLNSIWKIWAE